MADYNASHYAVDEGHDLFFLNILVSQRGTSPADHGRFVEHPSNLEFKSVRGMEKAAVRAFVTEDAYVAKHAESLARSLPQKLAELGVHGTCEEVLRSGGFMVVQCMLSSVDSAKLTGRSSGGAAPSNPLFSCCSAPPVFEYQGDNLDLALTYLPPKLARKLATPEMQVEIIAKSIIDQSAYQSAAQEELGLQLGPARCCGGDDSGCTIS